MPGRGPIPEAIIPVTKKGTSFGYMQVGQFADPFHGHGTGSMSIEMLKLVIGDRLFRAGGVGVRLLLEGRIVIRAIEIAAYLPNITSHVIEAVSIRRKGTNRSSAFVPILSRVPSRKPSLEAIGHPLFIGFRIVAPGEHCVFETPTSGQFPFGLGGKPFPGPFRIGLGIVCV